MLSFHCKPVEVEFPLACRNSESEYEVTSLGELSGRKYVSLHISLDHMLWDVQDACVSKRIERMLFTVDLYLGLEFQL